ncbi:MAG: glucose-6-phosphate isomerase, partial [Acidobacteria bacterium]|nr:glucose-6-phosphate isomerase [Acidobacteriota bacterium]
MQRGADLGRYEPIVAAALEELKRAKVVERIWALDHTVWKPESAGIANRLGWLRVGTQMRESVPQIEAFAQEVCAEGFTHALLLGMGGSSLAPEVFRNAFGVSTGSLDLSVLDSTHPAAVLAQANGLDPARTLFIVSTKSGGTVETLSLFKYFYNRIADALGTERAGRRFVAITDPGSGLADAAVRHRFRKTFLNDPNIGGRYSALSYYGLVPAALTGIDLNRLLDRASACMNQCHTQDAGSTDFCTWLGAAIGALAGKGRDKLTFILSPPISSFGAWVEQLIAESTGKEGRGILPVEGEALLPVSYYADDRVFVHLRLKGDGSVDGTANELRRAGHPVIQIELDDVYDLGREFFCWEFATAIAGHLLQINPFDQPNVESAKAGARAMMAAYQKQGTLQLPEPTAVDGTISIYAPPSLPVPDAGSALRNYLELADPGSGNASGRSYVA